MPITSMSRSPRALSAAGPRKGAGAAAAEAEDGDEDALLPLDETMPPLSAPGPGVAAHRCQQWPQALQLVPGSCACRQCGHALGGGAPAAATSGSSASLRASFYLDTAFFSLSY
jgi:hypothetical protein